MFFLVLFFLLLISGCSGSELGTTGTTGSSAGTLGIGWSTFVSSAGASPDSIGFSGSIVGTTGSGMGSTTGSTTGSGTGTGSIIGSTTGSGTGSTTGSTGSTTGSITGSITLSSPTILGSSRVAVVLFLRVFLFSFFSFCLDFIFACSSSLNSSNDVLFFLVLFLLSFGTGTTGVSPDSDGGITGASPDSDAGRNSISFDNLLCLTYFFSYFSTSFWISPIRVSLLPIFSSIFFCSFSNFFLSLLDNSGLDNLLFTSSTCVCSSLISVFFSSMCAISSRACSLYVFLLPSALCLL